MKKTLIISLKIFLFAVFLYGCVTPKSPGTKISASKYNPSSYVLHPKFKVYHENDTSSKLYLKLYTNELRYSSANKERINQAVIKVNYKITETIRANDIIDSAQTKISLKKVEGQTSVISFFRIKNIKLDKYYIEINLVDLYGNKKSQSYIFVDNSNNDNQQYYLSIHKKSSKPEFDEYFKTNDTFYIKHKNNLVKNMKVSFFKSDFKYAERPFIPNDEKIGLSIQESLNLPIINSNALFFAKKPGIYIIRADSTKIKGMMKVLFKDEYPLISQSYQLVNTLQYLLTEEEYLKMSNSSNKKLSVDFFWLNATKNKERAGELLKIWYNRATYSNYYFTTYKEGWKSDRGMVYIMFGPPDDIQHFDDAEKWIYINTKEDKKIDFIFIQQQNSISNNDFVLMRNRKYEPMWSKAIKSWRAGEVYHF